VAWILEESGKRCVLAAEELLAGMRDNDSVVRTNCASCLGWLKGQWLVPAMATLIFHLGDDFFVSCAAADSMLIQLKYHRSEIVDNLGPIQRFATEDLRVTVEEATCISAILGQERSCLDAMQGVFDQSQRIALAWTIKAASATPTMMSVLAAGMNSKHEPVGVVSAERLGREIKKSCSDALNGALASRSRRVCLALNHLASTVMKVGGEIQATLQVTENGEVGALTRANP
jgi:uncharacterized protein YfaA (DUF2138 family)